MVVSVHLILATTPSQNSSSGGSSFGGIKSNQITPNKCPENGEERWNVAQTPIALRVNMVKKKNQEICPENFQYYAETT